MSCARFLSNGIDRIRVTGRAVDAPLIDRQLRALATTLKEQVVNTRLGGKGNPLFFGAKYRRSVNVRRCLPKRAALI